MNYSELSSSWLNNSLVNSTTTSPEFGHGTTFWLVVGIVCMFSAAICGYFVGNLKGRIIVGSYEDSSLNATNAAKNQSKSLETECALKNKNNGITYPTPKLPIAPLKSKTGPLI